MQENYFVLYKRDVGFEKRKKYGQKMLYDEMKQCGSYESAARFAAYNMPAIVARQYPLQAKKEELRDLEKPYLVAAKFDGKYNHTSYDGSSDALVNFDAIRCSETDLENVIEKFVQEENFEKLFVGLELKLFPNFAKDYKAKIE